MADFPGGTINQIPNNAVSQRQGDERGALWQGGQSRQATLDVLKALLQIRAADIPDLPTGPGAAAIVDLGNMGASRSVSMTAAAYRGTLNEATCTVSFGVPEAPTNTLIEVWLLLTQDDTGGRAVTWPNSVRWHKGATPTLATAPAGVTLLYLTSWDAGTSWLGRVMVRNPDDVVAGAFISIGDATIGESTSGTTATLLPATYEFEETPIGVESDGEVFTLTNTGDELLAIYDVVVSGDFRLLSNTCGDSLAPGADCEMTIAFKPTAGSTRTGALSLTTDADPAIEDVELTGTGTAEPLARVSISGNQFVRNGANFRIKAVNWYGAENTNHLPDPMWHLRYTAVMDQIKAFGFNAIRFPFSGDFIAATPPGSAFDEDLNPEFVGQTALECLDIIVAYAGQIGLYIILDHHRRTAGSGADGSPIDGSYTLTDWVDTWEAMATRYGDNPTVLGCDLHNEPHDLDWATWRGYCETAGDAIHAIAPDLLIFVEGIGGSGFWWGENLTGVESDPVNLALPNKVAYSPHEYGQSVAGGQTWLDYGSGAPVGWPNNLFARRTAAYGYIFEDEIAPILVGEFGGFFGINNDGFTGKPYATQEETWLANLITHANGDFTGNGTRDIAVNEQGMSFAYFAWNPSSGDTGGLVEWHTTNGGSTEDWVTPIQHKLDLLAPLLGDYNPVQSPTIMMWYDGWWSQADVPALFQAGTGATRVANTRLSKIPSYCGYVVYAFVRPNMTYTAGSLATLSMSALHTNTGIDWSDWSSGTPGVTLKDAIALLRTRCPDTKVLLAVGGGTATTLWNESGGGPNYTAICAFIEDVGFDGVYIDYEPPGFDHSCSIVGSTVTCDTDDFIVDLVTEFRDRLPREDGWHVGICGNSIGCYGLGSWTSSLPSGNSNTGAFINLASSPAAAMLDSLQIMSYDTTTTFDPIESLEAYKHYFPNLELFVGARTRGANDAANIYFTKSLLEDMAEAVIDNNARGVSIYIMQWAPYPQDENAVPIAPPATSDSMPSAIQMCEILADYWSLPNADTPLWEGNGGSSPPAGWYPAFPPGLTATYVAETRSGYAGYVVHITGTASAAGALYIYLGSVNRTLGQSVTATYRSQVDTDDADITTLYVDSVEKDVSNATQTGAWTYTDWYSTRMSLALRSASRTVTDADTTHVDLEFLTNSISNGATLNFKFWIGAITISA